MSLTLTSGTRGREPGFSPSECLELAKRIERDGWTELCEACAETIISTEFDANDVRLIVAALRAYAGA